MHTPTAAESKRKVLGKMNSKNLYQILTVAAAFVLSNNEAWAEPKPKPNSREIQIEEVRSSISDESMHYFPLPERMGGRTILRFRRPAKLEFLVVRTQALVEVGGPTSFIPDGFDIFYLDAGTWYRTPPGAPWTSANYSYMLFSSALARDGSYNEGFDSLLAIRLDDVITRIPAILFDNLATNDGLIIKVGIDASKLNPDSGKYENARIESNPLTLRLDKDVRAEGVGAGKS